MANSQAPLARYWPLLGVVGKGGIVPTSSPNVQK